MPRLDPRWRPVVGPTLERAARCRACGALWLHEVESRMRFDGEPDDEIDSWRQIDEAEADRRFRKTGR